MILITQIRKHAVRLFTSLALLLVFLPAGQARVIPNATRSNLNSSDPKPEKIKPFRRQASPEALKWANKQIGKMSLDEKIGQLISVGVNATFLNQDSTAYQSLRHQIVDNHVGGIILFRGPVYESVVLVNRMQALAKYPLLISADLEAGAGMRFDDTVNFPWNMAIAARSPGFR